MRPARLESAGPEAAERRNVRLYQKTRPICWPRWPSTPTTRCSSAAARTAVEKIASLEYVQYLTTALSQVIASARARPGRAGAILGQRLGEMVPPGGTMSHVARVQLEDYRSTEK